MSATRSVSILERTPCVLRPCRLIRSGPGAHLEVSVVDPGVVTRLRDRGRAAHDAAVGEPEGAAVPGAGHAAVGDAPLVERPARMAAGGGDRVDGAVVTVEQDRRAAGVDSSRGLRS